MRNSPYAMHEARHSTFSTKSSGYEDGRITAILCALACIIVIVLISSILIELAIIHG